MRRKIVKWLLGGLALYALALLAWAVFALWGGDSTFWRGAHLQSYVFWQGGDFYSAPPLFGPLVDSENALSEWSTTDANDVQIWVLLLEGADDLAKFPFRNELGVDEQSLRSVEQGKSIVKVSAGVYSRIHPFPLYVDRKLIIIESAKFLRENYRADCLGKLIYLRMLERNDPEQWNRCKIAK